VYALIQAKMLEKVFITRIRQTLLKEWIVDVFFSKINALNETLNGSPRVCASDAVASGLNTSRPAPLTLAHCATSRVASLPWGIGKRAGMRPPFAASS
jgi:hypothetical protein